jgi:ribonuclease Z
VPPDFPNNRAPQFDFTNGQLVVPHPTTTREEIQEAFVREQQINPKKFYPKGDHPHLLEDWPIEGNLIIPLEMATEDLTDETGAE